MDIVITYVNGCDPVWQESYRKALDVPVLAKRYRDWGTLKYLLRGIETNMPFVRNVFLVVSSDSQVPEWADRSVLKVVRHEDIIPHELLPVFNSTAIEMFLHRIEGLDEQYLYFNDDTFPVAPCSAEDFFVGDKAVAWFAKHIFSAGLYKKQVKASDAMARRAVGLGPSMVFIRPQHTVSAMLRSLCEELHDVQGKDILATVSPLRKPTNVNQYMFSDYFHYRGRTVRRRISNKHFSLAVASVSKVCAFMQNPTRKLMCVNDVNMPDDRFEECRGMLIAGFEKRFTEKSRFEK